MLHSSSCSAQSLTPPCTQAWGQRKAKVSRGMRFGDTGPRGTARTPRPLLCWLTPLPSSGMRPRPTSRATIVLVLEKLFGARQKQARSAPVHTHPRRGEEEKRPGPARGVGGMPGFGDRAPHPVEAPVTLSWRHSPAGGPGSPRCCSALQSPLPHLSCHLSLRDPGRAKPAALGQGSEQEPV